LTPDEGGYTVGLLVQANHGRRRQLVVAGVPVGQLLGDTAGPTPGRGSIIIVVATDAPLLPHQLRRLAKRATLGLGRTGGSAANSSGDIFVAFSTANAGAPQLTDPASTATFLPNGRLDTLFDAVIAATEEAIINALVAAETMVGQGGHRVEALPHADLIRILRDHRRS
jgi:D-aminopeptidase